MGYCRNRCARFVCFRDGYQHCQCGDAADDQYIWRFPRCHHLGRGGLQYLRDHPGHDVRLAQPLAGPQTLFCYVVYGVYRRLDLVRSGAIARNDDPRSHSAGYWRRRTHSRGPGDYARDFSRGRAGHGHGHLLHGHHRGSSRRANRGGMADGPVWLALDLLY